MPDCRKPQHAKRYCQAHYQRFRRTGHPLRGARPRPSGTCTVTGCEAEQHVRAMCKMHYARWLKHGNASVVKKRYRRESDRRVNRFGYVELYLPDHPNAQPSTGWALEHRVVMAEMLGRPLLPNETPHHINGKRHDNRPKNLELWVSYQPPGQRVSDLVEWARDILALYGEAPDG